jgi:hypothetical protein
LQSVNVREQQMQQMQQTGAPVDPAALQSIPTDVQAQIAQNANPKALAMYNQMLSAE